jgi:MraZ protein
VFTGEYRHTVDGKGRLAVPVRFRTQLGDDAVIARWLDTCLAIFPTQAWEDLATKVGGLPITDASARIFQRYVFAGAFEAKLDHQGRVLVPPSLRQFAALEGEAVVVGSRDHAEIWEPSRWDTYRKSLEDPDVLAQHLTGLGI